MKICTVIVTAILLAGMFITRPVEAQEAATKDTTEPQTEPKKEEPPAPALDYSGDIWNRSTLTGDWGGLRNELAKKGVTLDMDVTQIGQGVVNGGKSSVWQYGGRGDIILN